VGTGWASRLNLVANSRAGLGTKFGLLGAGSLASSLGAAAAVQLASWPVAAGATLLGLATLAGGARLARRLIGTLGQAEQHLDRFAQGRFEGIVEAGGHDALARLMTALKRVQTRLGFEFSDAKRRAINSAAEAAAAAEVARDVGATVAAATQGDFSRRIPTAGKPAFHAGLCDQLNQLIDTVSTTFREVQASAAQLSAASNQVSRTAQTLAHGASSQSASVEQTTASLHEISASVKQNAQSASVTDGIATQAAGGRPGSRPDRGGDEVDRQQDPRHRRHRLPDQPAGAQRRDRGRTRWRAWQGFCRGRGRGAQAGRAQPGGRAGDRRTRRQQRAPGRNRR
jgi:hypothetical protein